MGLGKTVQTIALFAYLMEKKNNNGPFLVLVPLSTLANWQSEFAKWSPTIKVIVYNGSKQVRKALWPELANMGTNKIDSANVCLCTYGFIINKHDRPKLSAVKWDFVVIDEGHRMKNSESKLSLTLATRYTSSHRLILTGTPLQNSLKELWALLNFVLPNIFNSSDNFEQWFNAPFTASSGVNTNSGSASAQQLAEQLELVEEEKLLIINHLHAVLRPFLLRRLKSDVAQQLPEKIEYVMKCAMSSWQAVVYEQIKNKGKREKTDIDIITNTTIEKQLKTAMLVFFVFRHKRSFFLCLSYILSLSLSLF